MTKLIDFGRVSEATKGTAYSSILMDPYKLIEGSVKYNTAPPERADDMKVSNPC